MQVGISLAFHIRKLCVDTHDAPRTCCVGVQLVDGLSTGRCRHFSVHRVVRTPCSVAGHIMPDGGSSRVGKHTRRGVCACGNIGNTAWLGALFAGFRVHDRFEYVSVVDVFVNRRGYIDASRCLKLFVSANCVC